MNKDPWDWCAQRHQLLVPVVQRDIIIGQNLVQFVESPLKWRGGDLNLAPGLTSSPQLLTGPAASEGSWRMGWERGKRCVLMGKCLQKELEGRGLPQTSSVEVRGGKRKTGPETAGHVLENFLTQTLPSGLTDAGSLGLSLL